MSAPTIIYTHTDEAPALATHSLLPIIRTFAAAAGIEVETRDISLAARIISRFPEWLTPEQRIDDHLAELGALPSSAKSPPRPTQTSSNFPTSAPRCHN